MLIRTRSLTVVLTLLALFLALSGAGAATGGSLILGNANSASATTSLAAPVAAGTAPQLSNPNTAGGSTPHSLNVAAGHPPLTVSSGAGKVTDRPRIERLVRLSKASPFPGPCGASAIAERDAEVETSIAVDPRAPRRIVAAWMQD